MFLYAQSLKCSDDVFEEMLFVLALILEFFKALRGSI